MGTDGIVRFLNDLGRIKLAIVPIYYFVNLDAPIGYWCLQIHKGT